jgi:regulatory protein YycH of two-component signal transduction system YycFG
MIITILILLTLTLTYIIWNLLKKLEKLEELVEAQDVKLQYNVDKLIAMYMAMKEIDTNGAFESDDEVGTIFNDLKETIEKNLKEIEETNG